MKAGAAVLCAILSVSGCPAPRPLLGTAPALPVEAREVTVSSNVRRADFAGSRLCEDCHPHEAAAWASSPMHRMTRAAATAEIQAPFDGATYRFKEDIVRLWSQEGGRFLTLQQGSATPITYEITRVIGGRYREDFAGREVSRGATAPEVIMPISYVFSTGTFRPKGYSVLSPERPGLRAGPVWSESCIGCHNTLPGLLRLAATLRGGRTVHQMPSVDVHLPPERRTRARVHDAIGAITDLRRERAFLGGATRADEGEEPSLAVELDRTMRTAARRLKGEHLVEVGIGCEACHGGSAEHVEDPNRVPAYGPTAPWLNLVDARGVRPSRAERINRVCADCHQVLFSRYEPTWEGGRRSEDPGGSTINSGEARDFLLGACSKQMACTACHDPHAEDTPAKLGQLRTVAGNGVCLGCHPSLEAAEARAAHSHHSPESVGSACVNCHLPRKNMGLDYGATAYHRIGSPNDPRRVEQDRPVECAVCHTEASTEKLVATMEAWWGRRYDRQRLADLYGQQLNVPNLRATLQTGHPHEQAAAATAIKAAGNDTLLPDVAPLLTHKFPLIRRFAASAIHELRGCNIEVDASPVEIERQALACGLGGARGAAAAQ